MTQKPSMIVIALVAAVALGVRLAGLGDKPLWYDEILTVLRATLPLGELVADSLANKHFPTYFLLVGPFTTVDWDAWWLRLPSAVMGAVGVGLAARIAADIGGWWAALVAGLLLALSPIEVQYGQEARAYTLTSAAILLSLWGLVRLVAEGPDGRPVSESVGGPVGRRAVAGFLAYGAGMALALMTLSVSVPWLVAANLIVLVLWRCRRLPQDWPLRRWLVVNALVVLVWLPGLVALVTANAATPLRGLLWIPPLTAKLIGDIAGALYLMRVTDLLTFEPVVPAIAGLGPALVALMLLGVWAVRRRPAVAWVLVGAMAIMPIALVLVSIAKPMLLPRYLLWSTGPYFILAGIGAAALPGLLRPIVAVAVVAAAGLALVPYYGAETKSRFDLAAAHLRQSARPGDAVVTSSGLARFVLAAHLGQARDPVSGLLAFHDRDEIERRLAAGNALWLLHGRVGQGTIVPPSLFLEAWDDLGQADQQLTIGRHVIIRRIVSRGP